MASSAIPILPSAPPPGMSPTLRTPPLSAFTAKSARSTEVSIPPRKFRIPPTPFAASSMKSAIYAPFPFGFTRNAPSLDRESVVGVDDLPVRRAVHRAGGVGARREEHAVHGQPQQPD